MDTLSILYSSLKLKAYCKWLYKDIDKEFDFSDDLLIECILITNEVSKKEDIKDVVNYTMSIIHNEFTNKYSQFNRKYKFFDGTIVRYMEDSYYKYIEDVKVGVDQQYEIAVNVMDADLKREIKANRYPAGDKLFKAYLELKTYRNVSQKYGIPVMTCHRIITNYKKRINEAIR
jgi:hypothetical protein